MNIEIRVWAFVLVIVVASAIGAMTVLIAQKPRELPPGEVTKEELEKTKLILEFAERNCKKLGFRVEGAGAFVAVTCGGGR